MSEKTLDILEEVNLMLEGSEVSDDFKSKLGVIVEAAVSHKVNILSEELEAENAIKLSATKDEMIEKLEEANAEYEKSLEEQVSNYLDHVVGEWMVENKLSIDAGIKVERAENFMEGLQHLFSENFVEIPESGEDVIAISESKISEMESELHTQISKIAKLTEANEALIKDRIISEHAVGLTVIEAEKLISLTEDISFSSDESFSNKVKVIRESYFKSPTDVKTTDMLDESVNHTPLMDALSTENNENSMDKYLSALK